ncbi:MAG: hypothetical protein KGL39_41335 [Patescibacteria group bacterium]|nr:hypothetical protein [Patescibacteria group bacterium]
MPEITHKTQRPTVALYWSVEQAPRIVVVGDGEDAVPRLAQWMTDSMPDLAEALRSAYVEAEPARAHEAAMRAEFETLAVIEEMQPDDPLSARVPWGPHVGRTLWSMCNGSRSSRTYLRRAAREHEFEADTEFEMCLRAAVQSIRGRR